MGNEEITLLMGGIVIAHMISGGMIVIAILVQCAILWKIFK